MSKCKIQAGDRITMRQGVAFYDCLVTHACKDRLEVEEELSFAQEWSKQTKGTIINRLKWTIDVSIKPRETKKVSTFKKMVLTTAITATGITVGYVLATLLYKLFN